MLAEWSEDSGSQVIAQAEATPCLVMLLTLPELMENADVINFVDSDPARFSLVAGTSTVPSLAWIGSMFWEVSTVFGMTAWLDRVPGISNNADQPSRLEFKEMESVAGATRIEPVFQKARVVCGGIRKSEPG